MAHGETHAEVAESPDPGSEERCSLHRVRENFSAGAFEGLDPEAGAVERVIGAPKHPYSQLLVSSIPLPDLSRRWGDEGMEVPTEQSERRSDGCRFAPRCPHVMEKCWRADPAHSLADPDRAVACHLDTEGAPLSGEDIAQVFTDGDANEAATHA